MPIPDQKTLRTMKVVFEPQLFPDFTMPNGYLNKHHACQALWKYATLVIYIEYQQSDAVLKYEGDWPMDIKDYKQLFTSIATMYGVQPEEMIKFWVNVDMQLKIMGSKLRVPEEHRYNKAVEIKSQ